MLLPESHVDYCLYFITSRKSSSIKKNWGRAPEGHKPLHIIPIMCVGKKKI